MNPNIKNNDKVPEIKNNAVRSRYPGGKGGSGVYQTIINLIPPHNTYIETHIGGGAIMRHKKPAKVNIAIDMHPGVIDKWNDVPGIIAIKDDASSYLNEKYSLRNHKILNKNTFIYCDPPYLMETRKGGKLYDYEYNTTDHIRLLWILKNLPCMVMVSGYHSALYDDRLSSWNKLSFEAMTRGGTKAVEWVWYNYPTPKKLHDYSFLGKTFRERERIKRKLKRWSDRLGRLPELERNAILGAINGIHNH